MNDLGNLDLLATTGYPPLGLEEQKLIECLRDMVKEKASKNFKPLLDELFLYKFLKAKKFRLDDAFSLMMNFYSSRKIDPEVLGPINRGPKDYSHIYEMKMWTVLKTRNPIDQSAVVICRAGDWSPESGLDYFKLATPMMFMANLITDDPAVQEHGTSVILDFTGIKASWVTYYIPPSSLSKIVQTIQNGFPARLRRVHLLYQPFIYNVLYALARPIVRQKNREKVVLHGSYLEQLHEYVDPSILPTEYGGFAGSLEDSRQWFFDKLYERHELYLAKSYYGYLV